MTTITLKRRMRGVLLAGISITALAACDPNAVDFDLRGLSGGFSTADAARGPLDNRPKPVNLPLLHIPGPTKLRRNSFAVFFLHK